MKNVKEIAKWLKDEVKFLTENEEYVGGWLQLENGLAITCLWEEGFGEEKRDDVIQSKENPDYALCVGIKIFNPHDTPDGWLYPWDKKTGELVCESSSIEPDMTDADYEKEAQWLLDDFNRIKDCDIDKDGSITCEEHEDASADAVDEFEADMKDLQKMDDELFDKKGMPEESLKEESKKLTPKNFKPWDKFIGVRAKFLGLDEYDEETEEYREQAGEEGTITGCDISDFWDEDNTDQENFDWCYWNFETENGVELIGCQGVCFELLDDIPTDASEYNTDAYADYHEKYIKNLKKLYDIEPEDLTIDELDELRDAGAIDD